jgi:hypothetical protein
MGGIAVLRKPRGSSLGVFCTRMVENPAHLIPAVAAVFLSEHNQPSGQWSFDHFNQLGATALVECYNLCVLIPTQAGATGRRRYTPSMLMGPPSGKSPCTAPIPANPTNGTP